MFQQEELLLNTNCVVLGKPGNCEKLSCFIDYLKSVENDVTVPTLNLPPPIKDECVYSCDTLLSPCGLYINLKTLYAVGLDYVQLDAELTGSKVYLCIKQHIQPVSKDSNSPKSPNFKLVVTERSNFAILYSYFIVCPDVKLSCVLGHHVNQDEFNESVEELISKNIPEIIARCCIAVISSSAVASQMNAWHAPEIQVSSYSHTIQQIPNPPILQKMDWKCQHCNSTRNLWVNLTDGYIGCGRKHYGINESGCITGEEGAAVRHYEEDPENRALAVKLGTLSPGFAEVYSYAEDAMVLDPKLEEHLKHFGIDLNKATRTEQTVTELEHKCNLSLEWKSVSESESKLEQAEFSKDSIGLKNFGNTCYMNSTIQLLVRIPEMQQAYTEKLWKQLLQALTYKNIVTDFTFQWTKTVLGLTTIRYVDQMISRKNLTVKTEEDEKLFSTEYSSIALSPGLFRRAACVRHPEFSSSRQQDAEEFLRFFLDMLQQKSPPTLNVVSELFTFQIEERLKRDDGSNIVKLNTINENILSLPVPESFYQGFQQAASFSESGNEASKRSKLLHYSDAPIGFVQGALEDCNFDACYSEWLSEERIQLKDDSKHAAQQPIQCIKSRQLKTFPKYLIVQVKRFFMSSDWTPKKVSCQISMPETLDLTSTRSEGLKEGEILWKDIDENSTLTVDPQLYAEILSQLKEFGFSHDVSVKAIQAVKPDSSSSNLPSVEACVAWIVERESSGTSISDPQSNSANDMLGESSNVESKLNELISIGFDPLRSEAALLINKNDIQEAIEWISENNGLTDADIYDIVFHHHRLEDQRKENLTANGLYRLVGFISHVGSSANSGHYVSHIKQPNNLWFFYNDEKVYVSKQPPFNFGYLYLYRRE